MNKQITKEEKLNLLKFLTICVILVLIFGIIAYNMSDKTNVLSFLDIYPFPSMASILTGIVSNVVFGIIDNGGLFYGMSALDPFLPKGELTRAGLGNTFSDGLGAFLGTFSGMIIRNITRIDDTPMWCDVVGIVIGCLIGLYVPKILTGKQ
jgi:hypothetical protein